MNINNLTFDQMPQAIGQLLSKVEQLSNDVADLKSNKTPALEPFISIEDATTVIPYAKSSIYRLVSENKIPFYKRGKHLQFKRSELLAWLQDSRVSTDAEIKETL